MAFNIFGSDKTENVVNNSTSVTTTNNIAVNPAFAFNFGEQFLTPVANTLTDINAGLIQRFAPLAEGIQGSIDNANRLAGDLRRTADFSVNPGLARAPQGPSPFLLIGATILGLVAVRKFL